MLEMTTTPTSTHSKMTQSNSSSKVRVTNVEYPICLGWFIHTALGLEGRTKKETEDMEVLCIGCLCKENKAIKERLSKMDENMCTTKEQLELLTVGKEVKKSKGMQTESGIDEECQVKVSEARRKHLRRQ